MSENFFVQPWFLCSLLCCSLVGVVPAYFVIEQAYVNHHKQNPDWTNSSSSIATFTEEWAASAALITNQDALCEHFHLTAKPYWMLFMMSVADMAVTGYFFGDGKLKKAIINNAVIIRIPIIIILMTIIIIIRTSNLPLLFTYYSP